MISALLATLIQTIQMVIQFYIWIVIIAALLSFVQPNSNNQLVQLIYSLTQPAFNWVRKVLPFVVVSGIDLSPIVIIFGLNFFSMFLGNLI